MNQNAIILIVGFITIGFIVVLVFINKKLEELKGGGTDDKSLLMLQQQLNQVSDQLNKGLLESSKTIQEQFRASAGIIKDVTEKLTKLEDTNKQVVGITEQLQGLEHILKNPKQRGILGEYYLETLLKNLFTPSQYQMQYKFSNGDIVDAVIFIKDKILPIDSKFSLENYNKIIDEKNEAKKEELQKSFKQDLKNRIDETAKYIKPKEGTMDFAFMFIPSEGIYYDLLVNQVGALKVNTRDLIEYAFKEKKVIIVSPTSFAAYLQTVLQGLKALQIEESVKDIINRVHDLNTHLASYDSYFQKVGGALGTAVNAYNNADKEFKKIDKDVTKITGESIEHEVLKIEKPTE
ncbi:MAG: DNA recombination protein RmuC [Patescibacteria group bacterium]|nr:DNA recombination protein RmuC [Patescibacteria group bacterium]